MPFIKNPVDSDAQQASLYEKSDKKPSSLAIADMSEGGDIGEATATVDAFERFNINQTTADQTITLPNPTDVDNKKIVYVQNVGTKSFLLYDVHLEPAKHISVMFDGTSWTGASGSWGTTSNLDLDTLKEMVDFVVYNREQILQAVKGETFKFDLAALPNVLKGNILRYYNTDSVFSSNFALGHNVAPFSTGQGFTSVTSTEDSPLGEKYEIYEVTDASNSYTLHLDSGSAGFLPVAGKTYQYGLLCRGVGSSIGKEIVLGFYKQTYRVNKKIPLQKEWSLVLSDKEANDSPDFNLYVHGAGQGANMALNEKFEVALYFVLQVD